MHLEFLAPTVALVFLHLDTIEQTANENFSQVLDKKALNGALLRELTVDQLCKAVLVLRLRLI